MLTRIRHHLPVLCFALLLLVAGGLGAAFGGMTWQYSSGGSTGNGSAINRYRAYVVSTLNVVQVGTTDMRGELQRVAVQVQTTAVAGWNCQLTDQYGVNLGGAAMASMPSTGSATYPFWYVGTSFPWTPRVEGTVKLTCTSIGTGAGAYIYFETKD